MRAFYPYSMLRYSICVPLSSASGGPEGIKTRCGGGAFQLIIWGYISGSSDVSTLYTSEIRSVEVKRCFLWRNVERYM